MIAPAPIDAREILAGITLLPAPAHPGNVWNRVARDGTDRAATAAAALDVITAVGLDRPAGRFPPKPVPAR